MKSRQWHIDAINKIFAVYKSCKTPEHLAVADIMLFRYASMRSNDLDLVSLLGDLENFALAKTKSLFLDFITKDN